MLWRPPPPAVTPSAVSGRGAHALLAPSAGASSGCENELDGEKLESSRLLVDSRSAPSVSGSFSLASRSTCSSLAGFGDPLRCRGSFSLGSSSSRVLGTCNPLRDRGAEARSARKRRQVSVFQDSFVSCMSPSQRVLHVSQFLAHRSSTLFSRDMHAVTNSCGSVHGDLHDNSFVHVNSCGALGHRNSCNLHAAGVQGGTKALSMSTRLGVGRPAVEKLASPQQAPGRLHEET